MVSRFIVDEGREVAGLTIDDLDVDRYELESTENPESEQVLVAARELDQDGLANTTWQGLRLINTHGCGLVVAPASAVQGNRRPAYPSPNSIAPSCTSARASAGTRSPTPSRSRTPATSRTTTRATSACG